MQKLMQKAGLTASDISVVELHDCFSIAMFMALEDMGFCQTGQSSKMIKDIIAGDQKLIINPSGGLKACGHPVGATGVKQLIEVAACIKSKQFKHGLTHNVGGTGGTAVLSLLTNNQYF
jgi:acetyl-CoA C-acetyltransferase